MRTIKYLLVAINSQFIHTNLAVRYVKKYADKFVSNKNIEIYETNINAPMMSVIKNIYDTSPDVIIFSTYIWNRDYIFKVVNELKKILPDVIIGLAGPEITYETENFLSNNKNINFVVKGEGEKAFVKVLEQEKNNLVGIYEESMPFILDEIPFPYFEDELMNNPKILYYESSRGCPFLCSYCISSIEKHIREFSLERVYKDLTLFLNSNAKLIKFVDRTFNLKKERYMSIWKFLIDNYREGISFHFEINANILDDEALTFLKTVPKDYFQFEIGVQSINPQTTKSINRENNLELLANNIKILKSYDNIHLHLDLIAGLPHESYDLFKNSFDYVYNLKPEMIQLGFLKLLQGTQIYSEIEKYNYKFTDFTPYEVLSNNFMSYSDISKLKEIEKIVDWYYNSGKFINSTDYFIENFNISPFRFYEELSEFLKNKNLLDVAHKDVTLSTYLLEFYNFKNGTNQKEFVEIIKNDYSKVATKQKIKRFKPPELII